MNTKLTLFSSNASSKQDPIHLLNAHAGKDVTVVCINKVLATARLFKKKYGNLSPYLINHL